MLATLKAFDDLCSKHNIPYAVACGTAIGAVRHQGFIPWDDDVDIYMFRDDYLRLRQQAREEFGASNYCLYSTETDLDYISPVPHFVDTEGLCVPMDFRKCRKTKYLKFGLDICLLENVPEDTAQFRKYARKAWVLGKFFYIAVTPCPNILLNNKILQTIFTVLIWCAHYPFSLPFVRRGIARAWNAHNSKYYGKTNCYSFMMDTAPSTIRIQRSDILPPIRMKFENIEVSVVREYDKMLRAKYGDYWKLPADGDRKIIKYYKVELPHKKSS